MPQIKQLLNRRRVLRTALAIITYAAGTAALHAQDVHFSQFYENGLLRNPALTAVFTGDYKVGVNYRNQGSGFPTPFQTGLLSAESKLMVLPGTGDCLNGGLAVVYDRAGAINFAGTSVYGALSYSKALGDRQHTFLSVGLAGGFLQRSVDIARMRFASQFVAGNFSSGNASGEQHSGNALSHFDASAGISLNGSAGTSLTYYIGVGAFHLSRPRESYRNLAFSQLATRWTGSAGFNYSFNERAGVVVHANYQVQDPYREAIGGALMRLRCGDPSGSKPMLTLYGGCFYRYQDAIIPTLKVDYANWAMTVSYDVPVGGGRLYARGLNGYEVSLFARGAYRRRQQPVDHLLCPRFELQALDGRAE